GVNRMLADKEYRKKVVENVKDPSVKAFWVDEFAKYTERFAQEATPAIQNKIGQFTSNALIRNMIGQPQSSFDIRKMMDEKKIIIVNLSKGRIGESNANLLGGMLITKIYLAAMSRADVPDKVLKTLPNFYLFVDEFQSFANESFADILSEARKYKLNLTMAHQYIEQMEEEVRAAVFGNVGTMITFRVGSYDAEVLEKEFAPQFTAEDIVNLGFAQIYLKLMIDGISSQPFSATTLPPIKEPEVSIKDKVIEESRAQFSQSRIVVEGNIKDWHQPVIPVIVPKPKAKVETPTPAPVVIPKKVEMPAPAVVIRSVINTNKEPSKKNVDELRKALSSVMKKNPKETEASKEVIKEIPEDVLKKILK
ncbi:MAG: type IV secretory system conjugative DNA transfer family protein, partial [Patescibacteria group bacterium]